MVQIFTLNFSPLKCSLFIKSQKIAAADNTFPHRLLRQHRASASSVLRRALSHSCRSLSHTRRSASAVFSVDLAFQILEAVLLKVLEEER